MSVLRIESSPDAWRLLPCLSCHVFVKATKLFLSRTWIAARFCGVEVSEKHFG